METMVGFNGEYNHVMDSKGRLIVPLKFREALGEQFILTKGLDSCLVLYPSEHWVEFESKLLKLSVSDENARFFRRFFSAGATECRLDKQGRILIPQNLREYGEIDKDVTVIGVIKTVEIWDRQRYHTLMEKQLDNMEDIAKKVAELGF